MNLILYAPKNNISSRRNGKVHNQTDILIQLTDFTSEPRLLMRIFNWTTTPEVAMHLKPMILSNILSHKSMTLDLL